MSFPTDDDLHPNPLTEAEAFAALVRLYRQRRESKWREDSENRKTFNACKRCNGTGRSNNIPRKMARFYRNKKHDGTCLSCGGTRIRQSFSYG